ncbi:MAG: hypothetical protein RLZZ387_1235 [Chloroflexota bacterium]|jgi:hypothetical protein
MRGLLGRTTLLAAGLYVGLAVLLTWPLSSNLGMIWGSEIAGADGWQKVYFFWWARYALEHQTNPLFARLLFAPHGARMELEPLMLPLSVPLLPVQYALGPVVAYNVATLLTLALNGLALYALALRLGAGRAGALVGGALFLASPIALTVIWHGQLEKATWFTVPLLMALLLELYGETPRPVRVRALLVAAAAALLLTTALLGLYVFLFTCIFCALLTLGYAGGSAKNRLRVLGSGALVGALAAIPTLLLVSGALRGGPADDRIWIDISRTQGADLLDLVLPAGLRPARDGVWRFAPWPHTGSYQSAAGYTLLALAMFGAFCARRLALPLLALALAMYVVGMGASLRVAGVDTGVPLPYRLIEGLPGVSVSRYPQLALLCTHMLLAALAAFGAAALAERSPHRWRLPLGALVAAVIVLEYGMWRVEPRPIATPAPVAALAAAPPAGSVVALPYNHDISEHLVYQMTHQKPIWGGYLARIPANYDEVTYVPILRELRRNLPDRPDVVQYTQDDRRTLLRFYGAAYVLYDRTQGDEEDELRFEALWRRVSDEPPVASDGNASVYRIPAPAVAHPQVYLRLGWWEPQEGQRWMSGAATVRLINPGDAPVDLVLRMDVVEAPAEQIDVTWRGDRQVLVPRAGEPLRIALTVPPGEHELRFDAATVSRELAGVSRLVSVRITGLGLEYE